MAGRTRLDTKVLDAIIKNLDGNVADRVAKVGFAVEARAKINIQEMEAIDTGALLNSVATALKGGGNVSSARSAARARNPDVVLTDLPEPRDTHTAYVGPTVEYGPDVHFGAHNMAARPFLAKAVTDTARDFREHLSKAVTNVK